LKAVNTQNVVFHLICKA